MDNKERQVRQDVSKIINSSVRVLEELPKDKFESLGGEKALVERTKTNIVDSLLWSNISDWAEKISKIKTDKMYKMDDFISHLRDLFEASYV